MKIFFIKHLKTKLKKTLARLNKSFFSKLDSRSPVDSSLLFGKKKKEKIVKGKKNH